MMFVLTSGDTVVVEILCRLVNVEEAVAKSEKNYDEIIYKEKVLKKKNKI